MAESTILTSAEGLRRAYVPGFFKALENASLNLWKLTSEFQQSQSIGEGLYFPFIGYSPKNLSGSSSGNTLFRDTVQRSQVQGKVAPVEIAANFKISALLKNVGTRDGAFNGGEYAQHVEETSQDLAKYLNRLTACSHGTSRLAVVQDTVTATSFTASVTETYPYGVSNLMVGDTISNYTDDAFQTPVNVDKRITAINPETRVVSFGESLTWTAGTSVYRAGMAGISFNGFRNLIADSNTATSLHGQDRQTLSYLNAVVNNIYNGGNDRELLEEDVRKVLNRIKGNGGMGIDTFAGNPGVLDSYLRINATLRQYQVPAGTWFNQALGRDATKMKFAYDGGNISLFEDVNLLPRALYILKKSSLRKFEAMPLGWFDDDGKMLRQVVGYSGGFAGHRAAWEAQMGWQGNLGIQEPNQVGVVLGVTDTFNGDTVA
jgi:hypothetical protein